MNPDFSAAASAKVLKVIYDYHLANCIHVATKLNLAELLYTGPKSIVELAAATDANPGALYRLLRVLAAEGIFRETADKVFEFTREAAALHGDTEGSVKYYLQAILGEHAHALANLMHSVMTGATAFDDYYKMDVWTYYGKHPEKAANFNKAMAGLTQYYAKSAIPAYPFNDFETIVDIGGGNGALMFALLEACPKPEGIIFDASFVIPQTEQLIAASKYKDRCSAVAGNFFESVPQGKDLYLLKYILHDWDDEACIKILHNCAVAMRPGSKVLILESVIPPGNTYHAGKYTDITMLACTRGRERSEADFKNILAAAGLQYNKFIDLALDEMALVEAQKI